MRVKILRCIFFILIILVSVIIFGFSAQNGEKSGNLSKSIITKIADVIKVKENNKNEFIVQGEKVIRKMAHFTIYTLLGICVMGFLSTFNLKIVKQVIITGIYGFFYATTDEFHQMFINGRNASFLDIMIDSLGILFGILIVYVLVVIIKNKAKNYWKKIFGIIK